MFAQLNQGASLAQLNKIDCSEMTLDEQLALAAAISDGLSGKAVALVKDSSIVIDALVGISPSDVTSIVKGFVSRRKDSENYSVETYRDSIVVRTPDPLARSRGPKDNGAGILPSGVLKCPFCGFVTEYQDAFAVHLRGAHQR